MVRTHDIFMFFHSYIVFLACWWLFDILRLMISLCTCVDIGPCPPIGYQCRMGVVVGLELPARRKERKVIDDMQGIMERLIEGVMDDAW